VYLIVSISEVEEIVALPGKTFKLEGSCFTWLVALLSGSGMV